MSRLAEATWHDASRGGHLVVPAGSTEQHGPNLSLGTDTAIVEALVEHLESARPNVWIAPTINIGASGEHAGFPGTLSLGREALTLALVELGRSSDHFDSVYFVNWHGGNVAAVAEAVEVLISEERHAATWSPVHGQADAGDLHAGRLETSLMLAIDPDSVRHVSEASGPTVDPPALLQKLTTEGVKVISPIGVLGDPSGANAAEGRSLLGEFGRSLVTSFDEFVAN